MDNAIGQRLAAFRRKFHIVMPVIAKATGISKENLYKWEKGTRPSNFDEYRMLDEYMRAMEEKGGPPQTDRRRGGPKSTEEAPVSPDEPVLAIPQVHLVVHFTEDSMIPLFKPGCRLCLRKVPYPRSLIWGNAYYFVDLNEKGILRRVFPTEDQEMVRLLSYDPEQYPVITRRYDELLAIYEVIGLLFI